MINYQTQLKYIFTIAKDPKPRHNQIIVLVKYIISMKCVDSASLSGGVYGKWR